MWECYAAGWVNLCINTPAGYVHALQRTPGSGGDQSGRKFQDIPL
jgi:hypothetical protein